MLLVTQKIEHNGYTLEAGSRIHIDNPDFLDEVPIFKYKDQDGQRVEVAYNRLNTIPYLTYREPLYQPYLLRWHNIHENQYRAGREIVEYYDAGIRNVILVAQMQSGKTGTARYLVHHYLSCQRPVMLNENIYFICGMNDNDLRMQAIREFQNLIPPENILFSKQLQKINAWVASQPDDSPAVLYAQLIIVDESHYAGNEHSHVDRFLKLVRAHDPYILSVSATPMAELATSEQQCKGRVYLTPGPEYYGIEQIFSEGRIYPSADITHNSDRLLDIIIQNYEEQMDMDDYKYNIIRLPSQWYYQDLQDEISGLDMNIDFINHHTCGSASKVSDFNMYLKTPPKKMTIIWIYNSLRAGKQLDTRYVGFVHDTASSGPDTIAQSLLGRIMGYSKRGHNVICYTDVPSARLMLTWVLKLFDPAWIPSGSRNICDGYKEKKYTWNNHPPICVPLAAEARQLYRTLKKRHVNRYPYKLELIQSIIDSATTERALLKTIFERYKPGKCGGVMIITEDNSMKTYRDFWAYNYRCYLNGMVTRGFDASGEDDHNGCYYYVFVNLNISSTQYGLALVIYKERIDGERPAVHVRVKTKSRYS